MTIQSTRTEEPTVDKLCTSALQLAGITSAGQTPQERELGQARDFLQMSLKDLQNYGVFARSVEFHDVLMVVGTYKYAMPDYSLNVVGDAMYINANQTDLTKAAGETIVQKQSRDSWQRNSSKDATGQPTLYFLNREEVPMEVWVWPIPDEAGTIRFQVEKRTADVSDGSATIDLQPYWDKFLAYTVAEMLAEAAGFDPAKLSRLANRAKQHRTQARQTANQGVSIQMSVAPGNNRRRR